jgi:hypothetical protein
MPPGEPPQRLRKLDAETLEAVVPARAHSRVTEAGGVLAAQAFEDVLHGQSGQCGLDLL